MLFYEKFDNFQAKEYSIMIIEQLLNEDNLTESEKHIAHYILDKSHDIDNLTSTEFGKASFSSQSSVIRFYKKLGFTSYREFISALIIERNEYFKVQDVSQIEHPSSLFSSYEDIQTTISRLYAETIIQTNLLLDKNTIIRICNRLMNATTIDVYGIGISDTLAKQLAFKLQSLGLNCNNKNGLNAHYIQSLDHRNVSICISLTGHNESIIKIAKELSQKKIYTIAISEVVNPELVSLCHENIFIYHNKYTDLDIMCSMFGVEYVINIIYACIISRLQINQIHSHMTKVR